MDFKKISSTDAQNGFGKLLDDVSEGPVTIHKNGRDRAIIISISDFEKIAGQDIIRPEIKRSLERSMNRWKDVYEALAK